MLLQSTVGVPERRQDLRQLEARFSDRRPAEQARVCSAKPTFTGGMCLQKKAGSSGKRFPIGILPQPSDPIGEL